MLPFTRKILLDWAGDSVFRDGMTLFQRGGVREVDFESPLVKGMLGLGDRTIRSSFRVTPDGFVDNLCPCRDSTVRGIVCMHVVALGLALCKRHADPDRELKRREELRRAQRIAGIDRSQYLQHVDSGAEGSAPARLRLELGADWQAGWMAGAVPLTSRVEANGRSWLLDEAPLNVRFAFTQKDDGILYLLEDVSEGPAAGRLKMSRADFSSLMALLSGKPLFLEGAGGPLTVNAAKMSSRLVMDLDPETGELVLKIHTELPFLNPGEEPFYLPDRRAGWVFGAGNFWPLERMLPEPFHAIYERPVFVPRPAVLRFMRAELPVIAKTVPVQTEITPDLFTVDPAEAKFKLVASGSPVSLSAVLYAEYGSLALVAARADPNGSFAIPDPSDLMRYLVRNDSQEADALMRLAPFGFVGAAGDQLSHIVDQREVLNFLGSGLPALRRMGWKVELKGKVEGLEEASEHAVPVVRVNEGAAGWFDVDFAFEDGQGQGLSASDIQRALLKNEHFIERNGKTILLDAGAINSMSEVFSDCSVGEGGRPGSFRMPDIYSAYVKSSLDALDGVDVEAAPLWLRRASQQNRSLKTEQIEPPAHLAPILRPYQKDGFNWLRFLEQNGFAGILADEMGLGKTLQTLAWLSSERVRTEARNRPALVVCPTSLVENWIEEARKFVPECRALNVTGSGRHEKWDKLAGHDLVVTSYALLRRDIDQYTRHEFSAIILDEAQHIKNRSTQNAIAAKKLRALHRLVLTGTPIENSVSDLWSIMDFLMPGYMGRHEAFRQNYELPIARGGPDGEFSQMKLRRKLQPFLLRRMKKDVAADLPPKIQKVASCMLTADQYAVYRELVESSRRRLTDMVASVGFQKSRMEVFKTLMRLRQTCCHLDLLKLEGLASKAPSGKLDMFMELIDEAMDGGHRILVFSQFVSMLSILRREMEQQGIRYCYLDGATKDRLAVVQSFNVDRDIPVFLISLKAGGTGLNLTGADMVVHFDPWWNPAVEDQASDRAHRIGQKRTVYCVKLITKGTVEEKVLAMQEKKRLVIDAALASDEQVMGKMTWEDVQELLTL